MHQVREFGGWGRANSVAGWPSNNTCLSASEHRLALLGGVPELLYDDRKVNSTTAPEPKFRVANVAMVLSRSSCSLPPEHDA